MSAINDQQYAPVEDMELDPLDRAPLPPRQTGKPIAKHSLSVLDITATLISFIFSALAVAVIWNPSLAVKLGQTNQLIIVGFALTIMSLCANRQIILATLLLEARSGQSTLQNFDALLRNTVYARQLSISPRIILLSLQALPLGLSAAYKRFSGGSAEISMQIPNSSWGFVASPGWPSSGNGLSLATNAYVPFWQDPGVNRTYGYNMYVVSNTTAVILDTPFPDLIVPLQAQLRLGEYVFLSATVNATVSENINLSPSQQDDANFWESIHDWPFTSIDMNFDLYSGLKTRDANVSEIFLSIWDKSHDTFESTAQRYIQSRRYCLGTWNITSTNISLINAELLQPAEDQNNLQNLSLALPMWYTTLLPEYNYIWYPRDAAVNTFPPLVASMVWARTVAKWGAQGDHFSNNPFIEERMRYIKSGSDITAYLQSISLKRSNLLLFVLLVNPTLAVLANVAKVFLRSTPIGDGFGLISLLSGVNEESLHILRGAALSGTLVRDVKVRFEVIDETKEAGRIKVLLDTTGNSGSLTSGSKYS